jgi:transcriptional regulator with XRE-family HTH domain
MIIGRRLKALRETKKLSQGDVEVRTGLLRSYTSRVENGHTVPSMETLEKFARVLEMPLYQLMYDGDKPPAPPERAKNHAKNSWESSRAGARLMDRLIPLIAKMNQSDRNLILSLAGKVAQKRDKKAASQLTNANGRAPAANGAVSSGSIGRGN